MDLEAAPDGSMWVVEWWIEDGPYDHPPLGDLYRIDPTVEVPGGS